MDIFRGDLSDISTKPTTLVAMQVEEEEAAQERILRARRLARLRVASFTAARNDSNESHDITTVRRERASTGAVPSASTNESQNIAAVHRERASTGSVPSTRTTVPLQSSPKRAVHDQPASDQTLTPHSAMSKSTRGPDSIDAIKVDRTGSARSQSVEANDMVSASGFTI